MNGVDHTSSHVECSFYIIGFMKENCYPQELPLNQLQGEGWLTPHLANNYDVYMVGPSECILIYLCMIDHNITQHLALILWALII